MDFVKNKYGIAFLLIATVAAVHYFFFYKRCEQPSKLEVQRAGLKCAMELLQTDPNVLADDICVSLGREADCILDSDEDGQHISEYIDKLMLSCMKRQLKSENKCVDKVEIPKR